MYVVDPTSKIYLTTVAVTDCRVRRLAWLDGNHSRFDARTPWDICPQRSTTGGWPKGHHLPQTHTHIHTLPRAQKHTTATQKVLNKNKTRDALRHANYCAQTSWTSHGGLIESIVCEEHCEDQSRHRHREEPCVMAGSFRYGVDNSISNGFISLKSGRVRERLVKRLSHKRKVVSIILSIAGNYRNILRYSFGKEMLFTHPLNRGTYVHTPSMMSLSIECTMFDNKLVFGFGLSNNSLVFSHVREWRIKLFNLLYSLYIYSVWPCT